MEYETVRIESAALTAFCSRIFERLGLSAEDAHAAADVLTAADVRGIPSHGVARLERYVNGLESGAILPHAEEEVLRETPTTLLVDARGAMGAPVSVRTMRRVMAKAKALGAAFASVRDSNHFGIAGYYAMLALEDDLLGLAMTNTAALGVPTFARQVMFGTNPIAFAAPADAERAFVLDMSTTVVTRGKLEVYERLGKPLPEGWAVDRDGRTARDATSLLEDMFHRVGGGILPLGGEGELTSGYKGYGLAVMVDILCAVLSGAPFGMAVSDAAHTAGRVSHCFGALDVAAFRDPQAFRRDMDRLLGELRATPPAVGAERVYVAGQKEFEHAEASARLGVPLLRQTYAALAALGARYGVALPAAVASDGSSA